MAVCAHYFTAIDEMRNNGSKVFWRDETWCNKDEERRFVWTDETTDIGRMRHGPNKGIHYFSYISTGDFCSSTRIGFPQGNNQ